MSYQLIVNINQQQLNVVRRNQLIKCYTIASANNGVGEKMGSECTPRGKHYIRAKIGDQAPINTVFIGRRATGETYCPALKTQHPHRDWILTRIMWLCGLESHKNRGGDVDTMRRHIYIHGCPDEDPMSIPSSHGCIKMRNTDVIELFTQINSGCPIDIIE